MDARRRLHEQLCEEIQHELATAPFPRRTRRRGAARKRDGFWSQLYYLLLMCREYRSTSHPPLDGLHPFRPDAWKFRVEPREEGQPGLIYVECYEVEVGGPMTRTRLKPYLELWWRLDETYMFELTLTTIDRYGQRKQWDLERCALLDEQEDVIASGS